MEIISIKYIFNSDLNLSNTGTENTLKSKSLLFKP